MKKVRVYKDFKTLPATGLHLFASTTSHKNIFASLAWLKNLDLSARPASSALHIYCLESETDASPMTAALPMWAARYSQLGLSINTLTSLSNFYTSLYSVIAHNNGEAQRSDIQALIAMMASEKPRWDVINFHPMDPLASDFDALEAALKHANMAIQTYFCFGNWYLDIRGRSYQEYFEQLPSKLKNTILRKSKQLIKAERLEMTIFQPGESLDKALQDYQTVYAASWKNAETYPAFIPQLIALSADEGWLRLGIAYIDGRAAAAQIWLVHHQVASIYKLAYDEQYVKLSVGSILTAHVMRHVIDIDKVTEVDYLTGDEAYKQEWMSHRRERWGITAFNRGTLAGVALAGRHILGRRIKIGLQSLAGFLNKSGSKNDIK